MKIRHFVGVAATLAAALPQVSQAQTITPPGPGASQVGSISNYTSLFSDLDGMSVRWTTSAGSCTAGCVGTWGQLNPLTWGVQGSGFSLTAFGFADTYGILSPYQWDLKGNLLTGFSLDATTANAVFDILNAPDEGTPGSNVGRPVQFGNCVLVIFCFQSTDHWNTTVTYSNEIGVGAAGPVGDLWGEVAVNFGTDFGGSTKRSTAEVHFSQDADLVEGGFSTPQSTVPEPTEMTLLATGLVGLAGAAARKRRTR